MNDEPKSSSEIVLYQTADGRTRLEVEFAGESAWLTQAQMAELFQTTKQNVSLHIQNIFKERELTENSVVKESLTTASDGKNYATKFYNLDVISFSMSVLPLSTKVSTKRGMGRLASWK
jgi:hypothetical protein